MVTFSNSLDIRLARTLINIAGENDQTKTMIDPCCGMGTVVLEGLALGYSIKGFDISRDISWKARCNLNHFGFDGLVSYEQMDQEIKQAGFEIRNRILRKKTEFVKFGRYIYVCY